MTQTAMPPARLTALSHGAGCACKLPLADLTEVLAGLPVPVAPDLLEGTAADDAAVWRRPDGTALVATTDFFTPVVDDPRTFGRIAAANAASDVFAMGGRPLFALNVAGWPLDRGMDELRSVLTGAADVAAAGGWVVVGGHTIDAAEPFFGQVVVGEVEPDRTITQAGACPGDRLVLTKPLGTGIVMTAAKRAPADATLPGGDLHDVFTTAVASMTRLNDAAADVAVGHGVRGGTDVTGFGLTGHLYRLCVAAGLAATVDAAAVPLLPGVAGLADAGFVPGGTRRNVDWIRPHLASAVTDDVLALLADAQTSGGLLLASRPAVVDALVGDLLASGHAAAVVGELHAGTPGMVAITGTPS